MFTSVDIQYIGIKRFVLYMTLISKRNACICVNICTYICFCLCIHVDILVYIYVRECRIRTLVLLASLNSGNLFKLCHYCSDFRGEFLVLICLYELCVGFLSVLLHLLRQVARCFIWFCLCIYIYIYILSYIMTNSRKKVNRCNTSSWV
jgi:hypothetical protein